MFYIKSKILLLSIIFILFILYSTNVFATETNTLIIDGYDMSDVYNYFSKEDAFFIVNWAGQGEYYIYFPSRIGYTSYCAISSKTSCLYYNSNWEGLDGHLYQFYKFNFDTLKFDKAWFGHPNDWTLDNTALVFAYASKGVYNQDHSTYYYEPTVFDTENIFSVAGLDFSSIMTSLALAVAPVDVIILISSFIVCCMSFAFMWFGFRKTYKIFKKSIFKGKISV